MKIHIIMHEAFESPGAIAIWAQQKNHEVTYSKIYEYESLPKDASSFDFLIVMGGPQSPSTTLEECPYFNAQAEIELIKQAVAAKKLVLGVCLGAQLIGEAFGGKCIRSPHKEIGVFEINLTEAAASDPIFSTFPKNFLVGHWHGDMPGLSDDAVLLAGSAGCPRQIIRYTPTTYGFQCHFEFTKEAVANMIQHCGHELVKEKYIQNAEELMREDYAEMNGLLFKFLDQLEKIVTSQGMSVLFIG